MTELPQLYIRTKTHTLEEKKRKLYEKRKLYTNNKMQHLLTLFLARSIDFYRSNTNTWAEKRVNNKQLQKTVDGQKKPHMKIERAINGFEAAKIRQNHWEKLHMNNLYIEISNSVNTKQFYDMQRSPQFCCVVSILFWCALMFLIHCKNFLCRLFRWTFFSHMPK